jgi:preprotein translocase subunit SecD
MPEQRSFSRSGPACSVLALALAVTLTACGGFGVERYREAAPDETLALRFVAEGQATVDEALPRLGSDEVVSLEAGALLRASHVAHVQLLEAGDGERMLVLQLRDEGRARLREGTARADGRRLALVAAGRVVATPLVRGVLDQGEIAVRVPAAQIEAAFAAVSADGRR